MVMSSVPLQCLKRQTDEAHVVLMANIINTQKHTGAIQIYLWHKDR